MKKKIKVLAICGFGVGTSLILRMNIEKVLKQNGIDADVENVDVTTSTSLPCDVIFTSAELYPLLVDKFKVPIIIIQNFMSNDEIAKKGIPVINEILNQA